MSRTSERLAEALEEIITEIASKGVEEQIDEKLDDFKPEIDADNVTGLEKYVENVIGEFDLSDSVKDELGKQLPDAVMEQVGENLEELTSKILATDAFKVKIDQLVTESLQRVFARLLNPPVAAPVVAPPEVKFDAEGNVILRPPGPSAS